jgi:hypothetical protein
MEESLLALLALIPPEHQHTVEALLAWTAVVSLLLVPLKALAARAPAHWRPWLDAAFKIFDWVAVNTRGLHTRPTKAPKK